MRANVIGWNGVKKCSLMLLLVGFMLLVGCVPRKMLIEADDNMVKNCSFTGNFGASNWQLNTAKEITMDNASKKGSTHLVFSQTIIQASDAKTGFVQYRAEAKGYKCPVKQ